MQCAKNYQKYAE